MKWYHKVGLQKSGRKSPKTGNKMFFMVRNLGLTSSLLRFCIFYATVVCSELRSNDFILFPKRLSVLICLLVVVPSLIVWNHVGFFLDDILYPDWRHQSLERPLFIVGNARSGTTWLHRLIALDDEKFTSFRTWEIIFAVSVTWRRAIINLYLLDQKYLFGLHYKIISLIEVSLVGGMTVHQVGLQDVEEDEWLMMHVFLSQLILLFFPLGGSVLYPLVMFDKAKDSDLPEEIRLQIFVYYKQCIQRHLYARSSHFIVMGKNNSPKAKIFLSKNPPFTMRLELLYSMFPDCRVACLLRDPLQSVPSMISYIAQVWLTSSSPRPVPSGTPVENQTLRSSMSVDSKERSSRRYPKAEDLLGFCIAHYTYPLEFSKKHELKSNRWAFVPYRDLLDDVESTVLDLLRNFEYHEVEDPVGVTRVSGVVDRDGDDRGVIDSTCSRGHCCGQSISDSNSNRLDESNEVSHSSSSGYVGAPEGSSSDASGVGINVPNRGRDRDGDQGVDLGFKNLSRLLRSEGLLKGSYVSSHRHSVEECCGMTQHEFKELLVDVFKAHPGAF